MNDKMTKIECLNKKYNILYAEYIDINSQKKEVYGEIGNLPYKGLYTNLLGTNEKIINLIHIVENNSEFEDWKQGDLSALIFKSCGKMVCLFFCSDKNGLEDFEYSKQIFGEYKSLLV